MSYHTHKSNINHENNSYRRGLLGLSRLQKLLTKGIQQMTFTTAFRPALNKDGFARLQYIGYEIKKGMTKVADKKTGEIVEKEWELLCLNFDVKGVVRGTSQKVSISPSFTYDEDNFLGKTLKALGYTPPTVEMVVNDEGFEELAIDENDEGFEDVEEIDWGIEEFLDSITDKVYVGKISKATEGKRKGFWEINVETVKPFVRP